MLKEKLPFVLINTLLLHIPVLALIHGRTELRTETQIHPLRVGWRNFFSSCAAVSVFFVVAGNSFRCYLPTIPVVQLCLVAQVSFLVVAGKSFRCYLLTNHTSCAIV
jgi:hypothetical protein